MYLHMEQMQDLLAETLAAMEEAAGGRDELLPEMSALWLRLVSEQIQADIEDDHQQLTLSRSGDQQDSGDFRSRALTILQTGSAALCRQVERSRHIQDGGIVRQIKQLIVANETDTLQLQQLSDRLAISKNHMARLFKKETGQTIRHYIIALKMKKACELLRDTALKTYEISEAVGYNDAIFFSRTFKRLYGMTPSAYRRRNQ